MIILHKIQKLLIIPFFIFGIIVLVYPSNNDLIFNGIPFDHTLEIFLICIALPILLFKKVWKFKIASIFLIFFILLKLISFYTPQQGFEVKQFIVIDNQLSKEVKSYNSIFNNGKSIISNGKKTFKKMPFSWMNVHSPNGSLNISNNNLPGEYKINFKIKGIFNVDKNQIYVLDLSQLEQVDLKLINIENKKTIFVLSENKTYEIELNKSSYLMEGEFSSYGDKTWFDLKNKRNELIDIYSSDNFSKEKIKLGNFIKYVEIILILFLLCLLIFNTYKKNLFLLIYRYKYELLNILVLFLFSVLFYRYNYFNSSAGISIIFNKSFLIAFYLMSLSLIAIFKIYYKTHIYSNKDFIYLVLLPTVCFFIFFYSENIFHTYFHTKGDDWIAFEKFSYQILILGEYLRAGEDFFYFRPLMRYIMSFFYLIFGQSFFPLQLFEIFGIIFCAYTIKYIGEEFGNRKYSMIFSLIFLVIIFGETFKINLGKGITEYYSLTFLSLYIYFLFKLKNNKLVFLIPIFGALGFWLREDHLPVTLFCSIILLNNFKVIDLNLKNPLKNKLIRKVLIINIILILYFLLLGLRNYFVGGDFRISHFQLGKLNSLLDILKYNIYPLIAGNTIDYMPRTFSILILGAIFLSLFQILKFSLNSNKLHFNYIIFPLLLIISILPYFYVANNGYPPRYSIMILYFSLLVLCSTKMHNKVQKKL